MFPRRLLMVLLGLGVVFGYGSSIAAARWRYAHGGGCHSSWHGPGPHGWDEERTQPAPAAPPQTVVVQPPAAAPAPAQPAPQIFVIMPGAQPAAAPVQVLPVQVPVAPAPAAAAVKPAAP